MPIPTIPRCLRYDIDESILDTSTRDNLERISQTLSARLRNVDGFTVDLREVIQNSHLSETAERTRAGVEDHRGGYCRVRRVRHSEPREVIQEVPVDDQDEASYSSYLRDRRYIITDNSLADLAARRNSHSLDLSDNLTSIPRYTTHSTEWNLFREEALEYIKKLLSSGAAIRYRIEVK